MDNIIRLDIGHRPPKATRLLHKSYADGYQSGMIFFRKYGIDICNKFLKKLQPRNDFDRGVYDAIEKALGG
jgi:hypothetical protein